MRPATSVLPTPPRWYKHRMGDDNRAAGFSLWVVPEGEVGDRLSGWIDRLALRFGTESFQPHVTLLSGISGDEATAREGAARAAAALSAFIVHLDGVDGRDEHFRCLFVPALEPAPLIAAHAIAAHAFGRPPDPSYQPHLSLVYGTLEPAHKLAIAHEAGSDVDARFEVRRLHLWRTDGVVAEWRELGVFEVKS